MTVKGTVLEGKVKSITSKSVVLETVYGKGDLVIDTKDIEAIETDVAFHVFHGDDVDSTGPVMALTPDQVTVKPEAGESVSIPFSEVYVARRDPGPEGGFLDRLGVELAYWEGNFDLAFSYINATDDSLGLGTALGLRRERGPSRLQDRGRLSPQHQQEPGPEHQRHGQRGLRTDPPGVRRLAEILRVRLAVRGERRRREPQHPVDLARRIRLQALH